MSAMLRQVTRQEHRQAQRMVLADGFERLAKPAHKNHAIVGSPALTRQRDCRAPALQPVPKASLRVRMR